MYKNNKISVIIAAAGRGKRMGTNVPKQYIKINGETILEITTKRFQKSEYVDQIIVVTAKDQLKISERMFSKSNYDKVIKVVVGGMERQDSINIGLSNLRPEGSHKEYILIHDGARPFVSDEIIERAIEAAVKYDAIVTAVPTKDTIRQIDGINKDNSKTLDRIMLYNVQTPQCFERQLITKAYKMAMDENFYSTDDGSLVERLGFPVKIIMGDYENIKITTKEDLKMETRVGLGYDVHAMIYNRKLILGGVNIPYEKGLLGHSDADVLIHALIDGLLGAAALGDIGKHFPDTDEKYAGISSIKLLEKTKMLINDAGFYLGNADITLIAEKPKISKYTSEMRKNIAEALDVPEDKINIKGTTTEKLGFVGREEGIAAEAVCILTRG